MTGKTSRILIAIIGFVGIVMLSASFAINPGPPPGITNSQLIPWGQQNETLIQAGAWLQIVGSFLQVVLTLGILYITGAIKRFSGIIVATAVVLIMGVSLVESSFYLDAIANGLNGDLQGLHASLNLILSIQHAYSIIPAPVYDAGLGFILLTTIFGRNIFGRILGYLGIAFGVVILILGFIGTFTSMQQIIDSVLMAQQIWLLVITVDIAISARSTMSNSTENQPGMVSVS